jgi:uncharacterized protein (DUF1330 family)
VKEWRVKYYAVVEMEITDQSWVAEYVKNVTQMIEKNGGRYLARTSRMERVEGERKLPQVCVIVEWPSKEIADACYASEEYRPYREKRKAGAKNEFMLVAGEDITKTARIAE